MGRGRMYLRRKDGIRVQQAGEGAATEGGGRRVWWGDRLRRDYGEKERRREWDEKGSRWMRAERDEERSKRREELVERVDRGGLAALDVLR
ncbi:hypothetical protein Tco_0876503 [Tanacetum coccineum]|uniref:Uncharacterized protein n=1 Tax=Tanacetum coccineum TaxID=301880 RepID=A0ABQ5BV91_9ASTR